MDSEYYEKVKWFDHLSDVPESSSPVSDEKLIDLQEEAMKVLSSETASYNIKRARANSNYRWMKVVMSRGTVNDKIAAYVVTIQDNPVLNLDTINSMIGIVKASKRRECMAVIDPLTELFLTDLLRPLGQLKMFEQQPLSRLEELSSGNVVTRHKYLSYWYFEGQLKSAFSTFVQALNTVAHDTVEANKLKAIGAMAKLLTATAEQEQNLLAHIVNKLGDPSQKIGSKTIYCLTEVLKEHATMQVVMLREVEKLIYRQNVSQKAQYYGLCFLTQFEFCAENANVASKLIDVYFSFFRKCVKLGDIDSRMMSVLLIGVNRAYPYAKYQNEKLAEHINTLYRIVHLANINVCLNALALLFQIAQGSDASSDRFYTTFYRKLLDARLATYSNPAILLNLLYKALQSDTKRGRIVAFVKRLLQLALHVQANLACAIVFLVAQISFKKEGMHILQLQSEFVGDSDFKADNDDDEERYFDVEDGTNATNPPKVPDAIASWVHRQQGKAASKAFDPTTRNPLFANAEMSSHVELVLLKHHFHPSMRLFVSNLLEGKSVVYTGDPLKDFALLKFLERFVFKNPKQQDESRKVSIFARRTLYQPSGSRAVPVMSNDYLMQDATAVPVDEHYLFDYMKRRYKHDEIKTRDDDVESVASDEFEAMLTRMSKGNDDLEDLDYMQEFEQGKAKKSKKRVVADEEDNESMSDMPDDDDLDSEFASDSDEDEAQPRPKKARKSENIFAAAEEFATLLEGEGSAQIAPGSLHQVANEDEAPQKQLDWESKRDDWIQGFNRAVNGRTKKKRFSKY